MVWISNEQHYPMPQVITLCVNMELRVTKTVFFHPLLPSNLITNEKDVCEDIKGSPLLSPCVAGSSPPPFTQQQRCSESCTNALWNSSWDVSDARSTNRSQTGPDRLTQGRCTADY